VNALELLEVDVILGPIREPFERRQKGKAGNWDLDAVELDVQTTVEPGAEIEWRLSLADQVDHSGGGIEAQVRGTGELRIGGRLFGEPHPGL
jgi:hypothetical protein